MSREDDAKIALWLGWIQEPCDCNDSLYCGCWIDPKDPDKDYTTLPYYTTSDEDAMLLLPLLTKKGYRVGLEYGLYPHWCFMIYFWSNNDWYTCAKMVGKSKVISSAITSAVIGLIDSKG